MSFRERLKEEISYKGFILKEVADKANISKRTLDSYVDSREIIPPADVAVRLAQLFDTTVERLVTGSDTNIKDFEKYKKFQHILDDLLLLPDEILSPIAAMIHTAAITEKQKNKDKSQIS